jgi:hypothetical protein
MLLDTHRATLPVAGFTIFNECGLPPYAWSVAHVNVAPLAPGSAVNNDGFPLSKPPFGSTFVSCPKAVMKVKITKQTGINILIACFITTS